MGENQGKYQRSLGADARDIKSKMTERAAKRRLAVAECNRECSRPGKQEKRKQQMGKIVSHQCRKGSAWSMGALALCSLVMLVIGVGL